MPYTRTTWVDYPATTTPITAARLNNIETAVASLDSGVTAATANVYTNEAARDAAITSPVVGMRAYLTASTTTSVATTGVYSGSVSGLPTVVETTYNGTRWVCTSQIASSTILSGSRTSTTFGLLDTGNVSVTLVTGTKALVSITSSGYCTVAGATVDNGVDVSGASTIAASTNQCRVYWYAAASSQATFGTTTTVFDGLTAGTNTFTLHFKTSSGVGQWQYKSLVVKGIA